MAQTKYVNPIRNFFHIALLSSVVVLAPSFLAKRGRGLRTCAYAIPILAFARKHRSAGKKEAAGPIGYYGTSNGIYGWMSECVNEWMS